MAEQQTTESDPKPQPNGDGAFQAELPIRTANGVNGNKEAGSNDQENLASEEATAPHESGPEIVDIEQEKVEGEGKEPETAQLLDYAELLAQGLVQSPGTKTGDHGDEDGEGENSTDPPKKKKKKKSRAGKSTRAVTGFEEFFADPPTTPQEAEEERERIYAPTVPFAERIEQCIQRYRAKRRMSTTRTYLFDKYLFLGGIDSTQRQFGGMDPDEVKISTADEIRDMSARDVIQFGNAGSKHYDPADFEHWVVDFPGIVKGFLSRFVPQAYPQSRTVDDDNQEAAALIKNFLNYVLQHDVCPEYEKQVREAQAICDIAPTELRLARELYLALPGAFNTAARFLFCEGAIEALGKPAYEEKEPKEAQTGTETGWDTIDSKPKLIPEEQLAIFRLAIILNTEGIAGDGEEQEALQQILTKRDMSTFKLTRTETKTYEVVEVLRHLKSQRRQLAAQIAEQGLKNVSICGTVVMRQSAIDHSYSNEPRPDEVELINAAKPTEKFLLEDELLEKLKVGFKVIWEVCELDLGEVTIRRKVNKHVKLQFVKKCVDMKTGFDTLLPQNLMLSWRNPVPNNRPAQSVFDQMKDENLATGGDENVPVD